MVICVRVEVMLPLFDDGNILFRFVISLDFLCFCFEIFFREGVVIFKARLNDKFGVLLNPIVFVLLRLSKGF